jgi:hypothetical protein
MKHSEILKKVGNEIIKGLESKLASQGISSSSKLIQDTHINVSEGGELQIEMPEYAQYVDSGTKPHMPPVNKIENWANQRGLNKWAVAINIKKYGTKAKPFLHVIDEIVEKMEPELVKFYGVQYNEHMLNVLTEGFPHTKVIK